MNVLAVIVGIEEYAAGKGWRLDGPALDACRFARWLTKRGVPADNITLLLSESPKNKETVADLSEDFRVLAATQANVREHVFTRLTGLSSDLLILYWGGHGFTSGDDQRQLLYSDAGAQDKRNLSLTALLRSMRTREFTRHPNQLVLVDACLTLSKDLPWTASAPGDEFPLGAIEPNRNQQVLFAASIGEQAINDDAAQTGLFSRVIRDVLGETWPPDPDVLRDKVNTRFEALRAEGRTDQFPSYLWFKSRSHDSVTQLVPETPHRLLSSLEYRRLERILHAAPAPAGIRALYREAARHVVGLRWPDYPDDLVSCVQSLRNPVSALPLFEFLARLAAGADEPTHQKMWAWMRATAPAYHVDLAKLELIDDELRRTFFVLRVEPDLLGTGFQVTAWRFTGDFGRQAAAADEPWTRQRLADELSRLVADFDPDLETATAPVVEFMVPLKLLDNELETIPVQLAGKQLELGAVCPVVVRSLDRVTKPEWQERWLRAWDQLATRGQAYDETAIHWAGQPADPAGPVGHVCTALAYAAKPCDDPVVLDALSAGMPVMVWHRAKPGRRRHRQALERVLRGRGLSQLPDVVLSQRIAAREGDVPADHPGRDLVLLWDDPTRVPQELDWQPPGWEGAAS